LKKERQRYVAHALKCPEYAIRLTVVFAVKMSHYHHSYSYCVHFVFGLATLADLIIYLLEYLLVQPLTGNAYAAWPNMALFL
jgi:hypothetical protein